MSKIFILKLPNFFKFFFEEPQGAYDPDIIGSQIHDFTSTLKFSGFCGHHGVFGPFFRHRGAKKGEKKVETDKLEKKNYHQKNCTSLGYYLKKKLSLYDKNSLRYIQILFALFRVPTR